MVEDKKQFYRLKTRRFGIKPSFIEQMEFYKKHPQTPEEAFKDR